MTTPVQCSPRLPAHLLSQPTALLQRRNTTTPASKKRSLQHDSVTSKEAGQPATKKLRLDTSSSFTATVMNYLDHSLALNYDQYTYNGNALLVTKKSMHYHSPAGYVSRLRLVVENSGKYQLQVCVYVILKFNGTIISSEFNTFIRYC